MLRPEVSAARKLRREMSYPEVLLWQRLRGQATGARFRRQYPVGPYIADFYCATLRLVIEVDGQIHGDDARVIRDTERNRFFCDNGYGLVRIPAADILRDADAVSASIATLVARPLHRPSAGPPPRAGEDQE